MRNVRGLHRKKVLHCAWFQSSNEYMLCRICQIAKIDMKNVDFEKSTHFIC